MNSNQYYQLKSYSYRLLRLKLRLAELAGFRQRSDIVGRDSYGRLRSRRQFFYIVYVGRCYGG